MVVFLFLYIIWNNDKHYLAIICIILSILLCLFELSVAIKLKLNYFTSIYNILDIVSYTSIPIVLVINIVKPIDMTVLSTNLFINTLLLVISLRSLTLLRIFESVRYMIAMIT